MQPPKLDPWHADHSFGQDQKRPGEAKTVIVIVITAVMMVIEIAAGMFYNSMALLADGLHMASHAAALSVSAFAYIYARRYARDARFSFGTGKVNALGGFAGAVLLGSFAAVMVWESADRLLQAIWAELSISYNQAILVAVVGLAVNLVCALVLGHKHSHPNPPAGHESCSHPHDGPGDEPTHEHPDHDDGEAHDHNLRAAYFHVMADAFTSVLAIMALAAAKFFGLVWLDPLMGIVGAVIVAQWSIGLIRSTSRILLDEQAPPEIQNAIRGSIEQHDDHRVVDLHVWSIASRMYAAEIVIVSADPQPPIYYKNLLPPDLGLAHVAVEVHSPD